MKKLFQKTKQVKYYITENGEVFSKNSHNIFKQKKLTLNKKRGYFYVRTVLGNYAVHRLVALSFLKKDRYRTVVNHIDGNKQNNNLNNLEWVTYKENAQHAIKSGLTTQLKKNGGNLKYTNKQCADVLNMVKSGMTYLKAGINCGMPYSTVAHLVRGSRRKIEI